MKERTLGRPPGGVIACYCVHDDWWFLERSIRSLGDRIPVAVFVSRSAWNGTAGDWERAAEIARTAGAEVVEGDWPDEDLHRGFALDTLRGRGHTFVLTPDGDEIFESTLLDSLLAVAETDLADRVYVNWDTYWKDARHVVRPPEPFRPLMMVNLARARHVHIREYAGGRPLLLGREHGIVHHLSYAGPNARIQRKIFTWGHRDELVPGWWERVWEGWDRNRTLTDLHPTSPVNYRRVEPIAVPEALREVPDYGRAAIEPPSPPEDYPSVSIVIPVYGGEEDLRQCLLSLAEITDLFEEVVVVDNASPDGATQVAEAFPFVSLIRNATNEGFARACNRGYEASRGEVVVFLNSDTIVPRAGFVRMIESLMISDRIGASGPLTNNAGYHQGIEPGYTSIENLDRFANEFADRRMEDREVDMLVGFCLACRRSALQEVGGAFDDRFGIGTYEDNDLCYRLRRAGYRLRLANRAYIHHSGSKTFQAIGMNMPRLLDENRARFEAKWREDLECGFASHISGFAAEPIRFDPSREPSRLAQEIAELAREADISLCMIVRNEERVLDACLTSAKRFFREIIVVDTGSTDRTREIALRHGAQVVESPWQDSFSQARNVSLAQAKGRWIFWMDADDTLPAAAGESILHAALDAPERIVGFVVPVQFVDEGIGSGTRVDHVKLFRNVPGVRFEGRIHEQILGSLRPHGEIARIDGALVLHSGYDTSDEGQARKRARDEKLLRLDLEERPNHPFVLFNLGMTAHYTEDHAGAADWLRQSIAAAQDGESHLRKAYSLLAVSLRELGHPDEALGTLEEGLAKVGEDPELRFQMAIVLTGQDRFEEALSQYERMPTTVDGHFSSIDVGILTFKRSHNAGVLCLNLGRYHEARDWFRRALKQGPSFLPSAFALFDAAVSAGDGATAQEALDHVLAWEGPDGNWMRMGERLVVAFRGEEAAEEAIRRAVVHFPDAVEPRLALGRWLMRHGRAEEAQGFLAELDAAGIAEATYLRGMAAVRAGQAEEAVRFFRRALELNPGHRQTLDQIEALEASLATLPPSESLDAEGLLTGPHVGALGEVSCLHSVVVVTHNSASTLGDCARSVLDTLGNGELIFVDNASTDATREMLSQLKGDDRVRVLLQEENLGYAKAANLGIRASGGKFVTLLNPDTEVFPGWLDRMRDRLQGEVAAVGPVTNHVAGSQFVGHYLPPTFRPPIEDLPKALSTMQEGRTELTRLLIGFCLMVPRQVWNEVGLLCEETSLGADDLELSWRLRNRGRRLAIATDVFVRHVGGASFASAGEEVAARMRESDAALLRKLTSYYGATLPSSNELWGCPIFDHVLAEAAHAGANRA